MKVLRATGRAAVIAMLGMAVGTATDAVAQGYGESAKEAGTVVDVAAAAGSFSTLLAAVRAAGLEETLRGDGPFTVFAPTDEAFAALPEGTVAALLENPEQLRAVLTYHVVPGKVMASDVVGLDRATTVQGSSLEIRTHEGAVHVGGATVTAVDIAASNGVIHVIDRVLLPPAR
jgi:uncharacterized surface protein with fasciclin (FAS1) repeats